MLKKRTNILIIGITAIAFILFVIYVYLPYADKQDAKNKFTDAVQATHLLREPLGKIPAFNFTDQKGENFSDKDLEGKVFVADFIYTSCESSCPMLSSNLTVVQNAIPKSEPFRIVSYSLDPERDSVPRLRAFADKYQAVDSIWYFLTGPRDEIYTLGSDGFMQSVINNQDSVINHSQKLILVDKNSMIRGFYNGMDSVELQLLIRDVNFLLYKDAAYE